MCTDNCNAVVSVPEFLRVLPMFSAFELNILQRLSVLDIFVIWRKKKKNKTVAHCVMQQEFNFSEIHYLSVGMNSDESSSFETKDSNKLRFGKLNVHRTSEEKLSLFS